MQNIVLGLHKDRWHHTGAAIVATGSDGACAIAHVNEERLDRVKNSCAFPEKSTSACLHEFGLERADDADLIVVDYLENARDWRLDYWKDETCRTDVFLSDLNGTPLKLVRHHLCHAAAAFFTSPFDEAAVLIVDGRGSALGGPGVPPETQTLWKGTDNRLELVEDSNRTGIGTMYEAITRYLGFGQFDQGKTMALAPFGANLPGPVLWLAPRFEGMHTDYGEYCLITDSELLADLPGRPDAPFRERCAYDIQQECERAMEHLVAYAREATGVRRLCLGGGVALNSVANNKVVESGAFDDVFINPACSDSGIAFGAALWGYHGLLGIPRSFEPISPYTGPTYARAHIDRIVERSGFHRTKNGQDAAVRLLAENKVVALYQGRSEMGPRALGNRSILMSPSRSNNREYLNRVIKRREPFRPFAPAVPQEQAAQFFAQIDGLNRFMLKVVPVRPEYRKVLAAVTHVDDTARVQTVTQEDNPVLHRLLCEFGEISGLPVLLNTSFNVAGAPIVETPEDAVQCFAQTEIDALLIDGVLLSKSVAR